MRRSIGAAVAAVVAIVIEIRVASASIHKYLGDCRG